MKRRPLHDNWKIAKAPYIGSYIGSYIYSYMYTRYTWATLYDTSFWNKFGINYPNYFRTKLKRPLWIRLRKGWLYQIGWIFGKVPKGGEGGGFRSGQRHGRLCNIAKVWTCQRSKATAQHCNTLMDSHLHNLDNGGTYVSKQLAWNPQTGEEVRPPTHLEWHCLYHDWHM